MNKINFLLASVLTFTCISNIYAQVTDVFCAKPDGSDWYWLQDLSGYEPRQIQISGVWQKVYFSGGSYANYFRVYEPHYLAVNRQCRSGYVAQPGDNRFSGWSVFSVRRSDGTEYFTPGGVELYD